MIKPLIKTYPVTGMSCATCALNVEKALKKQPGVASARVNYANNSAIVEFGAEATDPASLQSAVRAIGYDLLIEETDNEDVEKKHNIQFRQLRINMIGSLALALPVMIISMFFMTDGQTGTSPVNIIMLILTIPVLVWFGRDFFINAFRLAMHGQANMDTLVALSTGIAFLFSLFNTFYPGFWHERGLHPHVYYEASTVIIAFILIGKVLEESAKSKTSAAIKKLMGLQPDKALLLDTRGQETLIPISQVKQHDLLRVKPGDKIPVDGEIVTGDSSIDESTITGESIPADKKAGDPVFAGTMNINGSFVLKAKQVGSETVLSRIILMVQQAQASKAPVQKTVDKVAGIFVPVVMLISLLSFTGWMILGGENAITHALLAMVTVLVIACPCALGLATPTAIMVGMGMGARNGILIKDAETLERIHHISDIVLDKTGTLTEGKPVVTKTIWLDNGQMEQEYKNVLLAMERQSSHPLAEAIVTSLQAQNVGSANIEAFQNFAGKGVRSIYKGKTFVAGNLRMFSDESIPINKTNQQQIKELQDDANTVVLFGQKDKVIAIIGLADTLKKTSADAIDQLNQRGISVHMLTGDNPETARAIASRAGIVNFRAGMMPSDKADYIKDLQTKGKVVAMVGDGVNDSQALAQADVSVAMGKGSDIAMDVAGMTIMSSDLMQIPKAIRLSKLTVNTIHQNLFWAFIYNLIGIPVAAGVLYPVLGIMLNPMIAAAAMALSSVSVVSNSLRLKTKKL